MTATIRVRVNPAGNGEWVVYADSGDRAQPWVRSGGGVVGWEYHVHVADWPEFELAIPDRAAPGPECPGHPEHPPVPSPTATPGVVALLGWRHRRARTR
ncbi:MAG: hypothetical protein M3R63_21750 [Actinomycetota bacterium]|nr:hypothetical protein [Actinomycetota bacterium]